MYASSSLQCLCLPPKTTNGLPQQPLQRGAVTDRNSPFLVIMVILSLVISSTSHTTGPLHPTHDHRSRHLPMHERSHIHINHRGGWYLRWVVGRTSPINQKSTTSAGRVVTSRRLECYYNILSLHQSHRHTIVTHKIMKRRSSILLLATTTTAVVAASSSSSSVGGVESTTATHLRTAKNHQPRHHHQHHQHQHANQQQQSRSRSLVSAAYCGTNWQDAHDTCNTPCEAGNDEECGAGRYCFTYMECTPSTTDNSTAATTTTNITTTSTDIDSSAATAGGVADEDLDMQLLSASSSSSSPAPAPTATMANIPSYIASLPVAPSTPTTPAPFLLTPPTPNTLPNPNSNYCGYDWESANSECFHACPSGLDDECPSGRKCHTWLKCTQAAEDPAIYSVCGSSWEHAASTCATR
jgi:hypothetical protein